MNQSINANVSISSIVSTTSTSFGGDVNKDSVFRDYPLLDNCSRLTVIELLNSDKQIANELVYRWCRILTRHQNRKMVQDLSMASDNDLSSFKKIASKDEIRVLILDMTNSINTVRLATVLKRDETRMRMIKIAKGNKINSTFVTTHHYLSPRSLCEMSKMKLVVIYQEDMFTQKTLNVIKNIPSNLRVLLILPYMDRQQSDCMNLNTNVQILRCEFCIKRRDLCGSSTYTSEELNKVRFIRQSQNRQLPDLVSGELTEDGLHLDNLHDKKKSRLDISSSIGASSPTISFRLPFT